MMEMKSSQTSQYPYSMHRPEAQYEGEARQYHSLWVVVSVVCRRRR